MLQRIKARLNDYKYRSVPWLIFNWKKGPVKKVTSIEYDSFDDSIKHISALEAFFSQLVEKPDRSPCQIMKDVYGFSIHKKRSSIDDAGDGVFIKDGLAKQGSIVALYPGTVYYPLEPLFFQSLGNSFILQCVDGVMVDGNDCGISCRIFRSSAARDVIGSHNCCDTSWLTNQRLNPLSIGQYINNANYEFHANVIYQELDIPLSFPLQLLQCIPNINFSAPLLTRINDADDDNDITVIRTVLLIALRDINEGEELFSSYFTEVQH